LYGGDMDNPVVVRVAEVCGELGLATLRFNFRGVGASTGRHGHGRDEQHDLAAALRGAIAALGPEPWLKLDSARRCVLTDMCFELGEYGLSAFHKLLAAMRGGDWEAAAAEMKASKYYEQVPKRAEQNRLMMLSGEMACGA